MKKAIRKLIGDMVPVVLGILIALLLNNWKQSIDDKKFVTKVLDSVTKELTENKSSLEEYIEKHQILLDSTSYYFDDESVSIKEIIGKAGGLGSSNIKNTSWQSFLNQKIELVDYEVISLLSEIEEDKQNLRIQIEQLISFVLQNLSSKETKHKEIFAAYIDSFLFTENDLLDTHNKFLELRKN